MVEVMVAHRVLWFAKELGFKNLIVKGDSEVIINAIKSDIMFHSKFGHILQDIIYLSSLFTFGFFCHVKRQGNCMAHRLARKAISNPFRIWMESVSPDALDVYNLDLWHNA